MASDPGWKTPAPSFFSQPNQPAGWRGRGWAAFPLPLQLGIPWAEEVCGLLDAVPKTALKGGVFLLMRLSQALRPWVVKMTGSHGKVFWCLFLRTAPPRSLGLGPVQAQHRRSPGRTRPLTPPPACSAASPGFLSLLLLSFTFQFPLLRSIFSLRFVKETDSLGVGMEQQEPYLLIAPLRPVIWWVVHEYGETRGGGKEGERGRERGRRNERRREKGGRAPGPQRGETKASSLSAGLPPTSSPVCSATRPCWTGRTEPHLGRVAPCSSVCLAKEL